MAEESYSLDTSLRHGERQQNTIYQKESSLLPDQQEVPEIIEVMNSSCDVEFDNDMGYSSHDSSCLQEEGSDKSWRQNPQGASKGVSCEDSPSKPIIDWSYNEDDSMQGVDEVEDLLYHFEKFFREKLEHHVKDFTSSMQDMFSEQQSHVRQIVNSTSHGDGYQDGDLLTELEEQDVTLKPASDVLDIYNEGREFLLNSDVRTQLLIELLSLSCDLSSLLHQDKFRA